MKVRIILSLCSFLGLWSLPAQTDIEVFQQSFSIQEDIQLSQDIYLPKDKKGPFPVVLIRTPYGKYQYRGDGNSFAQAGFAVVIQDVRGKFESSGTFTPFINETTDGLATLDWISKQTWCNGQVGIYGISYSGFCGLSLAASQHPILKSIVNFSGWVQPNTMASPGGANHLMLNLTWLLHEETLTKRNLQDYNLDSLFYYLPLKNVFRSIGIESKAWEQSDLLSTVNQNFDYSKVKIPILHLTGAYDFVKEATLEFYTESNAVGNTQQKLIFGPWFHNQSHTSLTEVGEVDFGPESQFGDDTLRSIASEWFWKSFGQEAFNSHDFRAEIFLQFDNTWETFKHWPPPERQIQKWFLSGQGLSKVPSDHFDARQYVYDPQDPVPTYGGANFHFFPSQLGIKDQSELSDRKDILHYKSPVFQKEEWVIGTIELNFYAQSSAPDTDFTAKLVLVDPEGFAMNLVDGIVRARHRNGPQQEELLDSQKIYPFKVELGNTAFKIPKGYHLDLEISSSNFPKYNRNTNTRVSSFESESFQIAQQKIISGPNYPSFLLIPTLSLEKK